MVQVRLKIRLLAAAPSTPQKCTKGRKDSANSKVDSMVTRTSIRSLPIASSAGFSATPEAKMIAEISRMFITGPAPAKAGPNRTAITLSMFSMKGTAITSCSSRIEAEKISTSRLNW